MLGERYSILAPFETKRIYFHKQTKERRPKRVSIRKDLVPVLWAAAKTGSFPGRVVLTPEGSPPDEDSLRKPWREPVESLGSEPMPRIHDLGHCGKTKAMRSGLHPLIAGAIVGHGDMKKEVRSVYLSISDEDLVREIGRMRFYLGETEIWVQK